MKITQNDDFSDLAIRRVEKELRGGERLPPDIIKAIESIEYRGMALVSVAVLIDEASRSGFSMTGQLSVVVAKLDELLAANPDNEQIRVAYNTVWGYLQNVITNSPFIISLLIPSGLRTYWAFCREAVYERNVRDFWPVSALYLESKTQTEFNARLGDMWVNHARLKILEAVDSLAKSNNSATITVFQAASLKLTEAANWRNFWVSAQKSTQ